MRFLLLFILLTSGQFAFSQNELIASLHKKLEDSPEPDTVRVRYLNEMSVRIFKSQPEKSLTYAHEALAIAKQLKFEPGIGEAQNNMAIYHLMKGSDDVALGLALEALRLGEITNDKKLLANSYTTLGTVYHSQLDFAKALNAFNEAHRITQQFHQPLTESKIYIGFGSIARDKIKYDSALYYYEEALNITRISRDEYRLPEILNNMGIIHQRQNNTPLAIKYYNNALKAAERNDNKRAKSFSLANLGNLLLSDKKYKEAESFLTQSLQLSKEVGDKKNISKCYMGMMQLRNEQGDYKGAHLYMMSFYNLKDSLVNAEKARQIAELEVRYETEKKELEIQLLERQNKIQQIQANVIVAVCLILVIASVIAYMVQRNQDNKNRQILNLEIDFLTSRHKELSEKFKNAITDPTEPTESLDQKTLRKAIEIVEVNISDPLFGVEQLGKEMGMSRTNLHRKIKGITGFPPSELIRSIRLRKAAALLLSQADSVSQISFAVGFEDQSYFSKAFKKQFGVSPSAYVQFICDSTAMKYNAVS